MAACLQCGHGLRVTGFLPTRISVLYTTIAEIKWTQLITNLYWKLMENLLGAATICNC